MANILYASTWAKNAFWQRQADLHEFQDSQSHLVRKILSQTTNRQTNKKAKRKYPLT